MHEKGKRSLKGVLKSEQMSLLLALLALCIVIGLLSDKFFTFTNIMNLLKQTSIMGIAALGVCFQILIGEIDLSLGTMQAACGCLMVFLLNSVINSFIVALLITVVFGMLVGLGNSAIFTKGKINSFITTLGTMSIIKGLTFVLTNASAVENKRAGFDYLGTGTIIGMPVSLVIFMALIAVVYFVLKRTTFGRKIYAVGGNAAAARLAGLNVTRIKMTAFIIAGIFISLTAVITASRLNSGQPTTGTGFELLVISAVILGGVSMTGGRGNLSGALLGVLILNVLSNGLVLLNVSSFYQDIARGIVIIIAVLLDEKRKRNLNKKLVE